MKIIEPQVELWTPESSIQHIARCARVCYNSKGTNNEALVKALYKDTHHSMFRHDTHYYVIPYDVDDHGLTKNIVSYYGNTIGFNYKFIEGNLYLAINSNWLIDYNEYDLVLKQYEVSVDKFKEKFLSSRMIRYTFYITTQISTTRELNRVSPNNIAERSTRYVTEEGTLCRPHWITDEMIAAFEDSASREYNLPEDVFRGVCYLDACNQAFVEYKRQLDLGLPKEDTRGLLPLDTMTKVVYTYDVDEWQHIINLRYNGTTGKPHPNCKIIIGKVKEKLNKLGYNLK